MAIVTSDLGLRLKLRSHPLISACTLSEELRLPAELDQEEQRTIRLEEELSKLKNRMPLISLDLAEGQSPQMAAIDWRSEDLMGEQLAEAIKAEKDNYPYYAPNPSTPPGYMFCAAPLHMLDGYNQAVNEYLSNYAAYIRECAEVEKRDSHTRSLVILVRNDGGAPAENLEINLNFPPGIEVSEEADGRSVPIPPTPPKLRKVGSGWVMDRDSKRAAGRENTGGIRRIRRSVPSAITKGGRAIDIGIGHLAHTREIQFLLLLQFLDYSTVHPFQITYSAWMSNYPRLVEGVLNAKISLKK